MNSRRGGGNNIAKDEMSTRKWIAVNEVNVMKGAAAAMCSPSSLPLLFSKASEPRHLPGCRGPFGRSVAALSSYYRGRSNNRRVAGSWERAHDNGDDAARCDVNFTWVKERH